METLACWISIGNLPPGWYGLGLSYSKQEIENDWNQIIKNSHEFPPVDVDSDECVIVDCLITDKQDSIRHDT